MKVHKCKARKDYPNSGIKKGDTYYWWKFNYGPLYRSLSYPKRSQLTQSEYLSTIYETQEELEQLAKGEIEVAYDLEPLKELLQRIEELRDEQEAKKENIPENLQESEVASLLQERYDTLDSAYGELERIIDELETSIEEIEQAKGNIQSLLEELSNISFE